MILHGLVSAATAGVLTIFDLDRTFYLPSKVPKRLELWAWYWCFVLINGALAFGLYCIADGVSGPPPLNNPWVRAIVIGASYLAIVRAKLTTFDVGGKDVPFGFELLYEAAKRFFYKRINRIAQQARYVETTAYANEKTLGDLVKHAQLSIRQNALKSKEEKAADIQWVLNVARDAGPDDSFEKRAAIADFILSGQGDIIGCKHSNVIAINAILHPLRPDACHSGSTLFSLITSMIL